MPKTKRLKTDKDREAHKARKKYPHEYLAPFEGYPKDVVGNFVWVPNKKEGTALFLFDDEEDRDRLAARYEEDIQAA